MDRSPERSTDRSNCRLSIVSITPFFRFGGRLFPLTCWFGRVVCRSFVRPFVRAFLRSFVRAFVRSFDRSCVPSFFRSFVRSIVRFLVSKLCSWGAGLLILVARRAPGHSRSTPDPARGPPQGPKREFYEKCGFEGISGIA